MPALSEMGAPLPRFVLAAFVLAGCAFAGRPRAAWRATAKMGGSRSAPNRLRSSGERTTDGRAPIFLACFRMKSRAPKRVANRTFSLAGAMARARSQVCFHILMLRPLTQ